MARTRRRRSGRTWENVRLRIDGQVYLLERPLGTQDPFRYYRLGPDAVEDADTDSNPFNQYALRPTRPPLHPAAVLPHLG